MLVNKRVDLLNGVKEVAERVVMVEGVNYICNVLAHIYRNVPLAREDLGVGVGEVSGEYSVDYSLAVCLIELSGTAREETEGRESEYSLCS